MFLHHNSLRYVDVERYAFLGANQDNQGSAAPLTISGRAYNRDYRRFTSVAESAALHEALPATAHLQLGRDADREQWWEDREELIDSLSRLL
jgi:hypothetical protein